jgi:NADH:ubiquinone oxidoreductase subunit 3 (subunit A)
MHVLISAAAPHAGHVVIPHAVVTAVMALVAAAIIILVLKVIGKALSPKKAARSASSPYGTTRR